MGAPQWLSGSPSLGDLLYVKIDPNDSVATRLWAHPYGTILRASFIDWEEGIQEAASVDWGEERPIGRAEPYRFYNGTGSKEIQLRFTFQAHGEENVNVTQNRRTLTGTGVDAMEAILQQTVVLRARFLDALKYPLYDPAQDISYAPPPCILKIGQLFVGRVICTQADIQWLQPWDPQSLLPHRAQVNATFTVVRRLQSNLSYKGNAEFAGIWQ